MSTNPRPWRIGNYELSAEEIADIVWLASFMDESEADAATDDQPNQAAGGSPANPPGGSPGRNPLKQRKATSTSRSPDPLPRSGELYPSPSGTSAEVARPSGPPLSGIAFPAPRPPGLAEKSALMRSLRPLLQRQPSRVRFEIDEEETAERIANAMGQGWEPAMRPVAERMFDLVLLIEESPSMGVWQDIIRDLRVLLIQTGIFRDVHAWAMVLEETSADDKTRRAQMSLRVADSVPGMARRTYEPRELVDPQQRRLILAVSDCSSAAWDNGAAMEVLRPLAESNAVSILQILPKELWGTTALPDATPVTLSSHQIVTSNAQFEIQALPKGWTLDQVAQALPIPVVPLIPAALNSWAHLMMGRQQERATGYYFQSDRRGAATTTNMIDLDAELRALGIAPLESAPGDKDDRKAKPRAPAFSVEQRYSQFLSTVPPQARRLAAYFAAAPLTLPIMRMVQQAMMGEDATHSDFVWVYYSSLLERVTPFTAETDPDRVQYDFAGGDAMRRRLLDSLPRYRVEQVQEELSRYVEKKLDQLNSFQTTLYIPGARGNVPLDDVSRHIAKVSASVLRYLGGIYAERAKGLEDLIDPQHLPVQHEHGLPIWIALKLPEQILVGERTRLAIHVYTEAQIANLSDTDASIHQLGTLRPGTQVQISIEAPDGSFVIFDDTIVPITIAESSAAFLDMRQLNLQANALGAGLLSIAFDTAGSTSENLIQLELRCAVLPTRPEPIESLRLRFEGDTLNEAARYAEAIEKYTAAIACGDDLGSVYQSRGMARHDLSQYREAEADYSAAITRGSEDYYLYIDRGTVRRLQNKYIGAIADFSAASRINPDHETAYFERGVVYGETGKFELAAQDFNAAIQIAPTAALYRNRGLSYYRLGKLEEALADYAEAEALDPNYARTYRSRGELYHDTNKDELAIHDYTKALELEPNADNYTSRGLAYEGQGDMDAALADFAAAIRLDPSYKWAYNNQGDIYRNRNEHQQALISFSKAIELDPAYTDAYNRRGLVYKSLEKYEAALADFAAAIKFDPAYKWAWNNQGEVYRDLGENHQAVAAFDQAIRLDPAYTDVYNQRGLAYKSLGNQEAALADFAMTVSLDHSYKWAYNNQGDIYRDRREYALAIIAYTKAIEIDSAYSDAYNRRGLAYKGQGDLDAALADFASAIEFDSSYKWAYYNQADIYRDLREYQQAISAFTKVIEIDPAYIDAYSGRALVFRDMKDERAALTDLDTALKISPTDIWLHIERVRSLAELEGPNTAEQEWRRLLEIFPNDGLIFHELGAFYKQRAAIEQARSAFQQAEKAYSQTLNAKPDYDTYFNRGLVNKELYRWDHALQDFSAAIAIKNHLVDPYSERAGCYLDIEAYDKAIVDYRQAITINRGDVYNYLNLAIVYYEQKDYPQALEACQEGIDLEPENPHGYMVRGYIHARRLEHTSAAQDAQHALELNREDSQVQRYCCAISCWLGDYRAALEHGQKAITLDASDVSSYIWLGHSFLLVSDTQAAITQYNQAIKWSLNRYFLGSTIRQIRELVAGRTVRHDAVERCVGLFEQAIVAIDRTSA